MNKRKLVTDRNPPGSIHNHLLDILALIKQETSEDFTRVLAGSALQKFKNNPYEDAIYDMASKRYREVDTYIMKAKQAISDAEDVLDVKRY